MKDSFKEVLEERAQNVHNKISASNKHYRQFTQEIIRMEFEINSKLDENQKMIFDKYQAVVLQRMAYITSLIYIQGFKDGIEIQSGQ